MKTNIKINKIEGTYTTKELDTIIESPYTINLTGVKSTSQRKQSRKDRKVRNFTLKYFKRFYALLILITIILVIMSGISKSNASEGQNMAEKIRIERLKSCQNAYKESGINKQFIYGQIPAVRCGTYLTLIYAFESNYGQSEMCLKQRNCMGMKGNGVDHKPGFITFKSYENARNWFANRYWKFHYKKTTSEFIDSWSETDKIVYKQFMRDNYFKIYTELEKLYLTN